MPIRTQYKLLQRLQPLPREFPETPHVLVIDPPYTDERLTDILRFVADAVERGEDCPITIVKVAQPYSVFKDARQIS